MRPFIPLRRWLDEINHHPVAFFPGQRGVVADQFELVQDGVLALLLPVIEEDVPVPNL